MPRRIPKLLTKIISSNKCHLEKTKKIEKNIFYIGMY